MAGKQSIFNIKDFRGGYSTDLTPELMANNELLQANNCWWRGGLKKRGGIAKYANLTNTNASITGAVRVYEEKAEAWYTIYGVDDGSTVEFQVAKTSVTLATVAAASLTASTTTTAPFTTGKDVEFDTLGGKVIAVNGTDRPVVLFPSGSGTFYLRDLDRYDERERSTDNWYAGQWDTSTDAYTDDTTDAQDSGVDDFVIASTDATTNGFYVAGDFTYSRLIFTGVDMAATVSAVSSLKYFDVDGSWTAVGTFNTAAVWDDSGTHTIEFELPLSTDGTLKWAKYDTTDGNLTNRYVVRGEFADGATSQITCDTIAQSHTHYLTQIIGDQKPQAIRTHKNHVFMAARNQVQIGIANSVKGWRDDRWEYFYEDGNEVMAMETLNQYLVNIKEGRMFAIDGTSWQNWSVRPLAAGGTISKRGTTVANDMLWMIARDGLYMFDGNVRRKVSKHIQTDIDSYTLTDVSLFFYKTDVLASFPTNSIVLVFDPDTLRLDDMGDGRVSFQKWTSYYARQILHNQGGGDDGYLILLGDNYTARGDNLAYDNITATTPINMEMQTKLFPFGGEETTKNFTRAKAKIGNVSTPAGVEYEFKFLTLDASNGLLLNALVGTGAVSRDISVPYQMDGKQISMYVKHNTTFDARVDTLSIDSRKRRY